jgi:cysteine desulfurase
MIYLDHAATTPMRPGVWDAMSPFSDDVYGNSSGVHDVSRRAKNALEDARERVAALIGARPLEIVFTSGGTESDNLALKGAVWNSNPRLGIITVATEHEAILESVDVLGRFGAATTVLGVDRDGRVDVEVLVDRLDTTTSVVSAMLVNNETGTINDVATLAHRVKEVDSEILVHTDAVQAFSTESIDVRDLGVDMLTLTAHKFGGPKGAGLLYVKEGTLLEPLLHGGGQELGRRSGTHDVAAAVGLAQAMELSVADRERFRTEIGAIRDHFEKLVTSSVDWAVVNTPEVNRSPHHFNVRFPGVRNETLLLRLDQIGLAASAGSACQSGAATVSHVLEAMGLSASEARASVRFTFGWNSTMEEGIEAAEIVTDLVASLR